MRVVFKEEAGRKAWMVCCYFKDQEEYDNFLKWDGRPPFPRYGFCVARLHIPKGAVCVRTERGPDRCDRAFLEELHGPDGKPVGSGIATSMYDTEVICRAGEEIRPARALDLDSVTERFTGIHYFDQLEDALRWAGREKDYVR